MCRRHLILAAVVLGVAAMAAPTHAAVDITFPFADSVEVDSLAKGSWSYGADWTTRSATGHSGRGMWWAKPSGTSYVASTFITLGDTIDLSAATNPFIQFWLKAESPGYRAYYCLEISTDGGVAWARPAAETYFDSQDWLRVQASLVDYKRPYVKVRIGIRRYSEATGILLDDIIIDNAPSPQPIYLSQPTNNGMRISWLQSTAQDFAWYRIILTTIASSTNSVDDFWAGSFVGLSGNPRVERRILVVNDKSRTDTTLTDLAFTGTRYYARIVEGDTQLLNNQGSDRADLATTSAATVEIAPFIQDFERGFQWIADYPWGVTKADSAQSGHSAKWAMEDSPAPGNYASNSDRRLVARVNCSAVRRPVLRFRHRYSFEGADAGTVSYFDGSAWTDLYSFKGVLSEWRTEEFDIGALSMQGQASLQFKVTSDAASERDGWHLDDVEVYDDVKTTVFPFADSVEVESVSRALWIPGIWRIGESPTAHSGSRIWTATPPASWQYLTLSGTLNLSGTSNPHIAFWIRNITGSSGSYRIQASGDGGIGWEELKSSTAMTSTSWTRVQAPLGSFLGANTLIRIGASGSGASFQIDDVLIDNAPVPQAVFLSAPTNNGMRVSWKQSTAADFARYRVVMSSDQSNSLAFDTPPALTGRTETRVMDVLSKVSTDSLVADLVFTGTAYYARLYEEDTEGFVNQGTDKVQLATTMNLTAHEGQFIQGFEGAYGWAADLPWTVVVGDTMNGHSQTHVLEDSPGALYPANADRRVVAKANLSSVVRPILRFNHRYGFESGDAGTISYSTDGSNWTALGSRSGNAGAWRKEEFDLGVLSRMPQAFLRFQLTSDGSTLGDGWYLDDVEIANNTLALPFPFSDDCESDSLTNRYWIQGNWSLVNVTTSAHSGSKVWSCAPSSWQYLTLEGTLNLLGASDVPFSFWIRKLYDSPASCYVDVSVNGGISWSRLTQPDFGWYDNNWRQVQTSLNGYLQPGVIVRIGVSANVFYVDDILIGSAPPVPALVAPRHGAQNELATVALKWNPSLGAATYRLQVAKDSTFAAGRLVWHDSTLSSTTRQVGPLAPDSTYFWRVNARNLGGTSAYSQARKFRVAARQPRLGDVSLNDTVTAYDASMVLRHAAGLITLEGVVALAGDVSGNGTVSAYDASLILQYAAELISCFPADPTCGQPQGKVIVASDGLSIPSESQGGASPSARSEIAKSLGAGGNWDQGVAGLLSPHSRARLVWSDAVPAGSPGVVRVPLRIEGGAGDATSVQVSARFDPRAVSVEGVALAGPADWQILHSVTGGELRVVMAGVTPVSSGELAWVTVKVLDTTRATSIAGEGFVNEAPLQGMEGVVVAGLPDRFSLSQNQPNPFNPATTIRFELPRASVVELSVYDLAGRKVRTLLRAARSAGSHSLMWDGKDDAGTEVASGVYFVRMEAGSFRAERKMALVR